MIEDHPTPSTDATVDLAFRYSERDYVRGYRTHLSTRVRMPWDGLVALAVLAAAWYLWHVDARWVGAAGFEWRRRTASTGCRSAERFDRVRLVLQCH